MFDPYLYYDRLLNYHSFLLGQSICGLGAIDVAPESSAKKDYKSPIRGDFASRGYFEETVSHNATSQVLK